MWLRSCQRLSAHSVGCVREAADGHNHGEDITDEKRGIYVSDHPSVVLFTSQKSEECKELKQLLRDNSIEYRDRSIDTDYEARNYMNNTHKANNTTPVVVIGSRAYVGYTKNMRAIKKDLGLK